MPRIWTILLLAAWVISPGRALAKPHGPGHCDPSHIQAEIKSTHQVPDLTGCRPEVVGPALSSEDYRLNVENRVASANIPEGRIVRQRVEGDSSKVYVDVSAGPPYKPQQPAGGHEPGHHSPNVGDVLGGIVGTILTNLPPPDHEPQVPPTNAGMPPPPPPQEPGPNPFTGVTAPPPPAPVPPAPPPPPAPPTNVATVAPATAAPAPIPAPKKTQLAQNTEKPPPKGPAAPPPTPTDNISPPEPKPVPPPAPAVVPLAPAIHIPPPPPPTRFSIAAAPSVKEGDELELVIQRANSDGRRHVVQLDYSDPSLLVSAPTSYDFGSDLPDRVILKLRTVAYPRTHGDHELAVTLASAGGAEVGRPDSVMAVILDQTSWWQRLLERLSSLPLWAVAVAAAAAAAAVGGAVKLLMPRASCSIEPGKVGLGPRPLRSCWPALRVHGAVGDASFSIPRPLPIGAQRDARPKPA